MSKHKHTVIARAYNKKGHCISVGKNSYTKTHRLQAEYGERTGNSEAIFLHAELVALLKAREPVYKLEIIRLQSDGSPALARPCAACNLAIREFGVEEVVFT